MHVEQLFYLHRPTRFYKTDVKSRKSLAEIGPSWALSNFRDIKGSLVVLMLNPHNLVPRVVLHELKLRLKIVRHTEIGVEIPSHFLVIFTVESH